MLSSGMMGVSSREAALERVRRERARRSLVAYSEYVSPWYQAARHHYLIAQYLEQVKLFIATKGREGIGRLMVFAPPRHGKSEQVSVKFPSYCLGHMPDIRVILTSYGADLAKANSRQVRDTVTGDKFAAIFGPKSALEAPVEISDDSRSASAWDLASPHRGGVVAAGVGGGITGRGAHLFIIDDPFKNREEAESQANREAVESWYTSTAYTRLENGGAVVGMLTRWHQDDWAGKRLKAMLDNALADQWTVLNLTALAEGYPPPRPEEFEGTDEEWEEAAYLNGLSEGVFVGADPMERGEGEALWPEKYPADALKRIEANVGQYDWAALYQQRPFLRMGNKFKRAWVSIVDALPEGVKIMKRVRYWDKATTAGGGARTAGVLLGLGSNEQIYVEHVHKGQWSEYQRDQEMLKMARMDKDRTGARTTIWHEQEPGSSGLDAARATNRMFAKEGFSSHFAPASGSKETRAEPWASAWEGGMVHLLRAAWNAEYIDEHVAFPKGTFKDQVDASSGGYGKLGKFRESNIR